MKKGQHSKGNAERTPQSERRFSDAGEHSDGPTKADTAALKERAKADPANQNPPSSPPTPATSGGSSSKSTVTAPGSTIVALMFFGTGFALIGNEIKSGSSSHPAGISGGKIILGGFAATAVLVLLSHAGKPGASFATGLAGITAASSILVYGGPVWSALGRLSGSAAPVAAPTSPTKASTPTKGIATPVALAQAA